MLAQTIQAALDGEIELEDIVCPNCDKPLLYENDDCATHAADFQRLHDAFEPSYEQRED
jgi:hypothetical protein